MIDLLELIPRAHAAARAKGFWPEDAKPNAGQFLMLTIGELGECQEAHRRGRVMDAKFFAGLASESDNAAFKTMFEVTCKDTSGDELGDAYIRLCDFAGGFGYELTHWGTEVYEARRIYHKRISGAISYNFAEHLLQITHTICAIDLAHPEREQRQEVKNLIVCALARMEALATREGIDLAQHIELKLRYNSLRPAKHGKAY